MSSQGHSKDPGKPSHDNNKSENSSKGSDKHGSPPTKWKQPISSSSPISGSPPITHPGPSSKVQTTTPGMKEGVGGGGVGTKGKKMGNHHTPGREEHKSDVPILVPIPVLQASPDVDGLLRLKLDAVGGAMDVLIGNGFPRGSFLHNSNDQGGGSDNSDNYSDHESGSSMGEGAQHSGRNSNQSPSDSCALQATHISVLPENVLENIFSFIDLGDIRNTTLVCQEWSRVISDENNEVWRTQCFKRMSRDVVYSEILSSCATFKAKLRAHIHSWNPLDCSRNIYVKPNGFTIHRNPVAQSTDGARGKIGFNRGRHAWEIVWEGPLGTVAVVGVATQQAEVRAQGYIALLGKDDQSWGWNLVENLLLHNGDSQGNYPVINNAPRYQVGERIRVILDCEDNTLSFEKNFEFLGVAFRGLPNREKLYPAVSAVYGNTEISMVYLGPPLDG